MLTEMRCGRCRDLDVEMLDKELQQIVPAAEQRRRMVDKLVKVWRRNGQDDWMMDLPEPMETLFLEEIYKFEEETHMPFVTPGERIWQERGLEKGLQEGRREGRQEGQREGLLEGIELALKLKFGPDGLLLLPEILQIADVELLRAIHRAIETAPNSDALRRNWLPEKR